MMTEYEYAVKRFHPAAGETVELPDEAIGVTISTWGDPQVDPEDFVTARYLIPVETDA